VHRGPIRFSGTRNYLPRHHHHRAPPRHLPRHRHSRRLVPPALTLIAAVIAIAAAISVPASAGGHRAAAVLALASPPARPPLGMFARGRRLALAPAVTSLPQQSAHAAMLARTQRFHRQAVQARRRRRREARQDAAQTAAAAAAAQAPAAPVPAASVLPEPAQGAASGVTPSSSFEACVIAAESGGNPRAVNPSSGAGGLYGFLPSTWQALGFSGLPQDASPAVQHEAFLKEYALAGTSPWAPYDGC
jgi:resuscitation-promoting factor RpfC